MNRNLVRDHYRNVFGLSRPQLAERNTRGTGQDQFKHRTQMRATGDDDLDGHLRNSPDQCNAHIPRHIATESHLYK
jgi:hypothetical protein